MSSVWSPTISDFLVAASLFLDTSEEAVRRLPRLPLAESALAAPFAGFGGEDAYSELTDKAAVLIERLASNHPLPDGNKRTSLALAILFLERNGRRWGEPDHDRDVEMVERIAAGEPSSGEIRDWMDDRTTVDMA